ncbi:MAG: carbon starvation protein A [Bacteroidales bacterium]|nr:carbon starvation protein A [Bacteroidales bacterium]
MISFLISIVALILGYLIYGRIVDRAFGPDPRRKTPAIEMQDGVDYIPLPTWKVYMIQFLNIAGTGPIFGAIMGAKFGPSSYLWIVLGCIFAGAVHDYMCGMLSVRHGGAGFPDLVGDYLGKRTQRVMLVFSIVLLLLVGTVFVYSPALILGDIAGDGSRGSIMLWVGIIFFYYLIATLLPIDKLIGKVYPIFAVALLFMAVALMVCLFIKWPTLPELWDGLGGWSEKAGLKNQPIFPCLFITIACGAISGFHATQSPLMARCIRNEKLGRSVFYGSMITEGFVALIWAAVASWFFFSGGAEEVGSSMSAAAPAVVTKVSENWLGLMGGILAILGVVAAPITSGDTAFRSARLIVADFVKLPQKDIHKRLAIAIPLFAASAFLLWYNIADANGFNVIWRYFGWSNQTLAVFMLWTATVYLYRTKGGRWYLITLLPALFMTSVCVTFIMVDKIGLRLPQTLAPLIGVITFAISSFLFYLWRTRSK